MNCYTVLGFSVFICAAGLLAGCQSQPKPVAKKVIYQTVPAKNIPDATRAVPLAVIQSKDGVQDIRWTLTQIRSKKALFFNQTPSLLLQSSNQRVLGNTGCNTLYGSFQINVIKQSLKFQTNAGHQPCDNALAQEAELMDALSRIEYFSLQGSTLVLYDNNRQVLLQAQR